MRIKYMRRYLIEMQLENMKEYLDFFLKKLLNPK